MKNPIEKEKRTLTFSYLDVFFLLLAFLIGSVLVYFSTEKTRLAAPEILYEIEASAELEEWIVPFFPQEGDRIFSEDGRVLGRVLAAYVREEDGVHSASLVFSAGLTEAPESGTQWPLRTNNFAHAVRILSVKALQEEAS